jgi:PAS domain S-box-containing protein
MDDIAGMQAGLVDELLTSVVNAAPDGILVVDRGGVVQFANAMATAMFGYDDLELLGQPVEILMPETLRGGHVAHREGYMEHARTRPMGSGLDLRGRRKSGEEFPVEIALSPVQSGAETHVIAVVRDVTERREAASELMQAHEQLALVDDRERIARDLHDTVIQRLFAVGLSLQAVLTRVTDAATAERIETAINEVDATIRDIRTSIFSLHARRMATTGLRDDVLATAREAGRALGFEPQVVFDGPVDAAADDTAREQLVATLREALSNVVKHAHAKHVTVTLAVDERDLVLLVVDDGVGIDPAIVVGGRGVGNMCERAIALGGRCETHAGDSGGTAVEWRVPRPA